MAIFKQSEFSEKGFQSGMIKEFVEHEEDYSENADDLRLAIDAIFNEIDNLVGVIAPNLSEVIDAGEWEPGGRYIGVCLPVVINVKFETTASLGFTIRNRRNFAQVKFSLSDEGEINIVDLEGLPFWLISTIVTAYTVWADLKFSFLPN